MRVAAAALAAQAGQGPHEVGDLAEALRVGPALLGPLLGVRLGGGPGEPRAAGGGGGDGQLRHGGGRLDDGRRPVVLHPGEPGTAATPLAGRCGTRLLGGRGRRHMLLRRAQLGRDGAGGAGWPWGRGAGACRAACGEGCASGGAVVWRSAACEAGWGCGEPGAGSRWLGSAGVGP
ncbi:hypothetical protein ACFQZ0_30290 [Streptomyces erythrogriseus]